jgi:hypothetical protein
MINEQFLNNLCTYYNVKKRISLSKEQLENSNIFKALSADFQNFYKITNGLESENLSILPFQDNANLKHTWDSIEKANNLTETKYSLPANLFKDFIIFGQLEGLNAVMLNKEDHSIWYEDANGYQQTDLNLKGFIVGILGEQ